MSILRFLYQTLCAFLQIKDRKHIEQNFHSAARVMPQGWDLGMLGGSKTLAWRFAMAPHRRRILVFHVNSFCHLLNQWLFFKINFFEKYFQEYHQSVKQLGLVISRQHWYNIGKELYLNFKMSCLYGTVQQYFGDMEKTHVCPPPIKCLNKLVII